MFITRTFSQILLSPDRRVASIGAGLLIGLLSGALALLLVILGPLLTLIGVLAILIGLYALTHLEGALVLLLAMVALLPFGTLPFRLGLTLSLIDAALGLFLLVYLFQWMTGERRDIQTTPVNIFILLFVLVMFFAFVRGLANAPLTATILRRFAALMANILMALIIVDVLRHIKVVRRVILALILFGSLSALVGIILWILNDDTANSLLNRLVRIGYPGGAVLRYREDGVSLGNERAIGTWVDPNAFGGFLMMVGALVAPQLLSARPLAGRRWLMGICFGLILLALFLTDSRGSMLGFLIGVGLVAMMRYRRLVWLMLAGILVALILPPTQAYIGRIIAGFQGADLATQMRFGEYRDALRLIERYPFLGVGFGAPPDIDLYLAVASTYLTIAGNAGLVGLVMFGITIVSVFYYPYKNYSTISMNDDSLDLTLGLISAIIGAMVGGIFDHFYFNIDFQATSLTLWLCIGWLLVLVRLTRQTAEKSTLMGM